VAVIPAEGYDRRLARRSGVYVSQSQYVALIKQVKTGVSPPIAAGESKLTAGWEWIPDAVTQRGGQVVSQTMTRGSYEWVVTFEIDASALAGLTDFLTQETVEAPVVMEVVPKPKIRPRKGGG
jgi:hypothetical protein